MGTNPRRRRNKPVDTTAFVPNKFPTRPSNPIGKKPFEVPNNVGDYPTDKTVYKDSLPDIALTDKPKTTRKQSTQLEPETVAKTDFDTKTATETSTQMAPIPTSVGTETIAKDRPEITQGNTLMSLRGRRPGGNEDHIPTDRPTGLARYGNGAYTDDQSLPYPDKLNENPIYPQEPGKWDTFSHIRILSTVMYFGFFPQTSFSVAGSNYDNAQSRFFFNFFDEMSVNYRANKQANKDFSDNFKLAKVFTYFYDTTALYAELCCLMARQAYIVDKIDPNNPANNLTLDQISIYLNTTEFWELRNRAANALATAIIPEYIWRKIRFMVQLHRIGPMETATKHMFNTPAMDTLLGSAFRSDNDDVKNKAARDNYKATINALIDLVEFGRTSTDTAIKRRPTDAISINVFEENAGIVALPKVTRNAISDFLQYCGIKFKSTGDLPPFPSHSVFNPKMCDIIANISPYILFDGTSVKQKAYPPIVPTTGNKPSLEDITMYTSMRPMSEQDATTLETLASKFKGCSSMYMDYPKILHGINSYVDFGGNNFRTATNYICEKPNRTTQGQTAFQVYPLVTDVGTDLTMFVESSFTTKLFHSAGVFKYASSNDDDNVPLYYATWGGIQKSMFNTKESFYNR